MFVGHNALSMPDSTVVGVHWVPSSQRCGKGHVSAKRLIAEFGNLLKRLKLIIFIYREAISARACSVLWVS